MPRQSPATELEHPPLHGTRLLILTVAIATGAFMELLDMTIVNVSVQSIAGSLGVTPSEGTWTVSSYMLAAAVVQPLTGWIGRRYGEVPTFITSISPCPRSAVSRQVSQCWWEHVSFKDLSPGR
jgi:DHA2 family multidrug resistance protein